MGVCVYERGLGLSMANTETRLRGILSQDIPKVEISECLLYDLRMTAGGSLSLFHKFLLPGFTRSALSVAGVDGEDQRFNFTPAQNLGTPAAPCLLPPTHKCRMLPICRYHTRKGLCLRKSLGCFSASRRIVVGTV
jgi:hypothetical protein